MNVRNEIDINLLWNDINFENFNFYQETESTM